MTVQTSYPINHKQGLPGALYDLHNSDLVSRTVETSAGADFGIACSRGSSDKEMVVGGTGFLGLTARDATHEGDANGNIKYLVGKVATIMQRGYMYIVCVSGCTQGARVKYNNTTGIVDAGVAGAGETQLDDAEWVNTVTAGEIGVVYMPTNSSTTGA